MLKIVTDITSGQSSTLEMEDLVNYNSFSDTVFYSKLCCESSVGKFSRTPRYSMLPESLHTMNNVQKECAIPNLVHMLTLAWCGGEGL